jgi:two-component system CheB/CheR fusion protein
MATNRPLFAGTTCSEGGCARPRNCTSDSHREFLWSWNERNDVKSRPAKKNSRPAAAKKTAASPDPDDFLIAALGASAGGMEAFSDFFRHLPADTGIAFVLIQHLDPTHESALAGLLSKQTSMKVAEVTDGMKVEPNQVFVIPPNTTMSITARTLHLAPRGEGRAVHMPIDRFMRSLAEDQGNRGIGVILSGTGSDGTLGMAEIQANGGLTFAQDESTSKYDAMPRSVISAGNADYVLPPKGIVRELVRIANHPYVSRQGRLESSSRPGVETDGLKTVFDLLRKRTGADFTYYRKTTILRRIHRRMVFHKFDQLPEYVKYLRANPAEINALYQDMLINVTSFFRTPALFEALKSKVFPFCIKNPGERAAMRVWTPGCASGEETYSVAIALCEYLGDNAKYTAIQLFGTDISETNIVRARTGFYPENIQGDVSPERLRRFFTRSDGGYRISKKIRELCVFAQHNLIHDPPYSQMDLVCCRNLLIYLEPFLQSKAISLFHYATRPGGYLVLGSSEGIGTAAHLFTPEDRALKIFSRKAAAGRQIVTFSMSQHPERIGAAHSRIPPKADLNWNHLEAQKEFDRRLLAQFSPAAIFVTEDMEIVHSRGDVNRYLKIAPGRASLNLSKMAREGLFFDLRNAITQAKRSNTPVGRHKVQVRLGSGNGSDDRHGQAEASNQESSRLVDLEVVPLTVGNLKELYFMIVFREPQAPSPRVSRGGKKQSGSADRQMQKLQQELAATKEYLQSVIETHEAVNEELQSANEEVLSSNEELQSTNEELETAKEELQSANEELNTVNDELRNRNSEVTLVNNDLSNLLSSIDVAVIMVSNDVVIRRFTPRAQKMLGLIPGDVGRPLSNVNPSIPVSGLQQMVLDVISNFHTIEKEIADADHGRYQLRILPYRTMENKIDGAVITLMGIRQQAGGSS